MQLERTAPAPVQQETQPIPAVNGARPTDPTRRVRRRRLLVHTLQFGLLVLVLGGWELGARTKFLDPFFFGQPSRTAQQIWTWVFSGTSQGSLWEQIWVTLQEAFLGFFIGVVLGVVLGVTLGRIRFLAEVFGPYIKTANSIPRIVLGSIFIIWFGLGTSSKVALAVVLVFFAVFFNAFQGTREVNRDIIANARILGASNRQVTFQVVLPSAMTWIIASLHTSFGFALIGAVVGEFLGATKGLGLLIATAQGTFNPNGVFAAMFILAVVALIAEGAITFLENRLLSWRPPQLASAEI
jgi:NitT/TauT family transport system permease protein